MFAKEEKSLHKEMRALYTITWGQCSLNVVAKLNQHKSGKEWRMKVDYTMLIQTEKDIVMKYDQYKKKILTLYHQIRYFTSYCQRDSQDLHLYFEIFQLMADPIDHLWDTFVQLGYL